MASRINQTNKLSKTRFDYGENPSKTYVNPNTMNLQISTSTALTRLQTSATIHTTLQSTPSCMAPCTKNTFQYSQMYESLLEYPSALRMLADLAPITHASSTHRSTADGIHQNWESVPSKSKETQNINTKLVYNHSGISSLVYAAALYESGGVNPESMNSSHSVHETHKEDCTAAAEGFKRNRHLIHSGLKNEHIASIHNNGSIALPHKTVDIPLNQKPISSAKKCKVVTKGTRAGKFTTEEVDRLKTGLEIYGRDWNQLARHIATRDASAVRSHAQKHFIKLFRDNIPLPKKVYESGAGYSLSGKPLNPNSAAARPYLKNRTIPLYIPCQVAEKEQVPEFITESTQLQFELPRVRMNMH
ncbi:hypothetical protein BATDEDRAFT_21172 [Batrachochytrium dendrobatidis JAM81]|uniref:HTH myb-type domain-containing protein n=1 Tax=Batrachochytrium dendrobatidis (strain JAM81 / FGSC 10211) TaxID=684364 RepID=F4NRJ6_BATDJ|nr:uncharacterized protein BATDEDRAFT_21172 [Batrachochytrium dendrobatidis JAM81]EGF83738.1 hypothetical protein BATDEDRAFT_21172 [Batrachochytrium dendrobatidis JAM81]|eukprot:XP_006675215.1 hypothetical protein BATDEDRAFT_21172 [Batrachochytrium dendrobatidis JAM81]